MYPWPNPCRTPKSTPHPLSHLCIHDDSRWTCQKNSMVAVQKSWRGSLYHVTMHSVWTLTLSVPMTNMSATRYPTCAGLPNATLIHNSKTKRMLSLYHLTSYMTSCRTAGYVQRPECRSHCGSRPQWPLYADQSEIHWFPHQIQYAVQPGQLGWSHTLSLA